MTDEEMRLGNQLARVLAFLPRIENKSTALPTGTTTVMEVRGRQAVDPLAAAPAFEVPDEARTPAITPVSTTIPSRSSARLVRLAKFSTPSRIRATAFYWDGVDPVVARVAIGRLHPAVLPRDAFRARAALGQSHLLRAPALAGRGRGARTAHLVEELVFGAHPRTPTEKERAGSEVIDRLFASLAHADLRYTTERTHPATRDRLRRLFSRVEVPAADDLVSATALLVDSDHLLPTGWSHGDLVFSNLIRHPDGYIHVIDWENAGVRPVIADLAKLAAAIPGTSGLEQTLSSGPKSLLEAGPTGLGTAQQLTRFYLQELSWWEPKFRRARETGRTATFDSWVNRRLELLSVLMGR